MENGIAKDDKCGKPAHYDSSGLFVKFDCESMSD